ncbi:50S ribosomal protein L35 [bacterium]|nr:50S ribosomal protein L35 [bacterium]
MARQKTNKTAAKRFKLTNPKGKKKGKLMYKQSHQNHLKTKKSRRAKRRQSNKRIVSSANEKNMYRKIVNL